jgi:hypothetical protein
VAGYADAVPPAGSGDLATLPSAQSVADAITLAATSIISRALTASSSQALAVILELLPRLILATALAIA